MEQFSNGAILKWSDSQMEQFSNGAILKWSDLGSPPYAIFQDPKNREIWHAMCYKECQKNFSHYLQKLFRISNLALLRARRSTTAVFLNGVKQSKSLCISSAYFYNS